MMKFFAAAALAMTLAFPMTAQAVTCTTGSCTLVAGSDGDALSDGVLLQLAGIGVGAFEFEGNFLNDTSSNASTVATVLQFAPSSLGNILDLTFNIDGPAAVSPQSFAITDGSGSAIGGGVDVSFLINLLAAPNTTIFYSLTGTAVAGVGGALPGVNLSITPVPVPAAGLMLLTVVGAGAFAARRKKKKA